MGGCLSSQAGGEAAERGQPKKQPYAKNKVVPEPTSNTNATAASASGAANGEATTGLVGPVDVSFQELISLLASISHKTLAASAPALAQAQLKLAQQLQALKPTSAPASIVAAAKACSACINNIMEPVSAATERRLGGGKDTTAQPQWDIVSTQQLLNAITEALHVNLSNSSPSTAAQIKPAAEVLHQLKEYADNQGIQLPPSAAVAPAVNQLASMLCLIFFRKVTVETQAALDTKSEVASQLLQILGWEQRHLAACIGSDTATALAAIHQGATHGQTKLALTVRRGHALWDSLDQAKQQGLLQQIASAASTAPASGSRRVVLVFPSFVDEYQQARPGGQVVVEAGEGHGPRKEFYSAVGASATGQQSQQQTSSTTPSSQQPYPSLFVFNRTAGYYWYNTQLQESTDLTAAYTLLGWLMGQSLLTRAPLNIQLPPLLFQQLLQGPHAFRPDLAALEAFDPGAATGVRNAGALPDSQFKGMLEMEGLPASTTREQYTAHAVQQLLGEGTAWQAAALARGWWSAVDRGVVESWGLGPSALAVVVGGSMAAAGAGGTDFKVKEVFRVVMDDELGEGGDGQVVGEMLWQVVESWAPERKCAFLEFVTGSSRLPPAGSELLKVEAPFVALGAAEHKKMLGMLPQAHTCDNLLELPNYWEALLHTRGHAGRGSGVTPFSSLAPAAQEALRTECKKILEDRLLLAVTGFSGYGLDERDGDGGGNGAAGSSVGAAGLTSSKAPGHNPHNPSTAAGVPGKPTGEAAEHEGQGASSKQVQSDMWDGITDSMARVPPNVSLIFPGTDAGGGGGKPGLKATPVNTSTGSTGGVVRYQRDASSATSYGASTLGSGVEWATGEGVISGQATDFSRAPSSSVYQYGSSNAPDDLVELGSIAPGAVSTTASGKAWTLAGANSGKSAGPSGLGYLEEGIEEEESTEGVPSSHPSGLPRAGPASPGYPHTAMSGTHTAMSGTHTGKLLDSMGDPADSFTARHVRNSSSNSGAPGRGSQGGARVHGREDGADLEALLTDYHDTLKQGPSVVPLPGQAH